MTHSPGHSFTIGGSTFNRDILLSDSARPEPKSDPVKPLIAGWMGGVVRISSERVLGQFHWTT